MAVYQSSTVASKSMGTSVGRTCGTCTLCCKVMAISELNKPIGAWCDHCRPARGCNIYDARPTECSTFNCAWLVDDRLGAEWKPDRAKIVVTIARDGRGIEIRCDPRFPQAWRQEPYRTQIAQWSEGAERDNGSVLVLVGDRLTLISPDREFYLGVVSEGDMIVREYAEGRVVNAYLDKVHP